MSEIRMKPNEGGNDLQPLVSRSRSTVLPFSGSSVQFWRPTTPDYASIRLQDLPQHFARDREYEEKVAGSSTRGVRSLLHLSWKRGIFRILILEKVGSLGNQNRKFSTAPSCCPTCRTIVLRLWRACCVFYLY
jgi:hypothetical protein